MMWTKTTYYCVGRTVRDTACHREVPHQGMFCWNHRDQKEKFEVCEPSTESKGGE